MEPTEDTTWLPRVLIEQHWSHIRHIESERRWMFMAYGTVVGGSLFFLAQESLAWVRAALLFTLFGFSLIGLGTSVRLKLLLDAHYGVLKDIGAEIGSNPATAKYAQWIAAPRAEGMGLLKVRYLFHAIYLLASAIFGLFAVLNVIMAAKS